MDMEETIIDIHWRLARVCIENEPYQRVIERYDRPHTFFYLDPPYYGIKVYRQNFIREDFTILAKVPEGLKEKFVMSINDHREVWRIFRSSALRPCRQSTVL